MDPQQPVFSLMKRLCPCFSLLPLPVGIFSHSTNRRNGKEVLAFFSGISFSFDVLLISAFVVACALHLFQQRLHLLFVCCIRLCWGSLQWWPLWICPLRVRTGVRAMRDSCRPWSRTNPRKSPLSSSKKGSVLPSLTLRASRREFSISWLPDGGRSFKVFT